MTEKQQTYLVTSMFTVGLFVSLGWWHVLLGFTLLSLITGVIIAGKE